MPCPHSHSASPGQSEVRVGLLSMGSGRVFQSLQKRCKGTLTRGRHIGHLEARDRRENTGIDGTSPAAAQRDSGPQTRAPARGLPAPRIASTPLAPGALTHDPDLLLCPKPTLYSGPGPLPPPLSRAAFNRGRRPAWGGRSPKN